MYLNRSPCHKIFTCEPQRVISTPTPLIVHLKSKWRFSFRCFTGWLLPLNGMLDLVSKRRTDSTNNGRRMDDSDWEGWNVYFLRSRGLSWRLDGEKQNARYIRPGRYLGFIGLLCLLCIVYLSMSVFDNFAAEEYAGPLPAELFNGKGPYRTWKCENCRTSKVKCHYNVYDPEQPCSRCQRKQLNCGPNVLPSPDSQTNRKKKWDEFKRKALPIVEEMFQTGEDYDYILQSLSALCEQFRSSRQTTASPLSNFSPIQHSSPAYPSTIPNPAVFPSPFPNNANTTIPQPTPLPAAPYFPVATPPYPCPAPTPTTFSPPPGNVPAPSFDPSQLSFPSNAGPQYQYAAPSLNDPSLQHQYPNTFPSYDQSMQYQYPPGYYNH